MLFHCIQLIHKQIRHKSGTKTFCLIFEHRVPQKNNWRSVSTIRIKVYRIIRIFNFIFNRFKVFECALQFEEYGMGH